MREFAVFLQRRAVFIETCFFSCLQQVTYQQQVALVSMASFESYINASEFQVKANFADLRSKTFLETDLAQT